MTQLLAKYIKAIPDSYISDVRAIFVYNKLATYTNGYISISTPTDLPDGTYDPQTLEPVKREPTQKTPYDVSRMVELSSQQTNKEITFTVPDNAYPLKGTDFIQFNDIPSDIVFARHTVARLFKKIKKQTTQLRYSEYSPHKPVLIALPDNVQALIMPVTAHEHPSDDNLERI